MINMTQPQMSLKGANPISSQNPNQAPPQQQTTNTSIQDRPQRHPLNKDRKFPPLGIPLETALQ